MSQINKVDNPDNSGEITFRDIILKTRAGIRYLKKKWITIVIISAIFGCLGLAYSFIKRPVYNALCTFFLDDSRAAGLGQYASLASLAGIDLGSSGGGVFSGDNIIQLYTSRKMIEKTLLTPDTVGNKAQLLIDRYINYLQLRKVWRSKDKIDSINFEGSPDSFNRKQDSLIIEIVGQINAKVLSVNKPDKKSGIFNVEVDFGDEIFAKEFNDRLVNTVNDFYVKTKTKKTSQNVQILQKQADSVRAILNSSITGVASALDAVPNPNPVMLALKVPSQKRQIDVQSSSAIYAEIIKNLELGKIALRQDMPLIQVIDTPLIPLHVTKLTKIKGTFGGLVLGFFISVAFLFLNRLRVILRERD
jgi:hypothetical protein